MDKLLPLRDILEYAGFTVFWDDRKSDTPLVIDDIHLPITSITNINGQLLATPQQIHAMIETILKKKWGWGK